MNKLKKIEQTFWQIYFWIFFIVLFAGYLNVVFSGGLSWVLIVDIIISIPALGGLCLYAYKKKMFSARLWQVFAIVYILWDIVLNLFILSRDGAWLGICIVLPLWIALVRYAFQFLPGVETPKGEGEAKK